MTPRDATPTERGVYERSLMTEHEIAAEIATFYPYRHEQERHRPLAQAILTRFLRPLEERIADLERDLTVAGMQRDEYAKSERAAARDAVVEAARRLLGAGFIGRWTFQAHGVEAATELRDALAALDASGSGKGESHA